MSDAQLLAFGCAVSFTALAGVYVYLRNGMAAREAEPIRGDRRRRVPVTEGR